MKHEKLLSKLIAGDAISDSELVELHDSLQALINHLEMFGCYTSLIKSTLVGYLYTVKSFIDSRKHG